MKNKRKKAQIRNWSKAWILGQYVYPDLECHTQEEIDIFNQIKELRNKLINSWDRNSSQLGFKVVIYNITLKSLMGEEFLTNVTQHELTSYKKLADDDLEVIINHKYYI